MSYAYLILSTESKVNKIETQIIVGFDEIFNYLQNPTISIEETESPTSKT